MHPRATTYKAFQQYCAFYSYLDKTITNGLPRAAQVSKVFSWRPPPITVAHSYVRSWPSKAGGPHAAAEPNARGNGR